MWSVTENRKRGGGLLLNWKRKPRADTKVKLNPEMSARLQHQGCKVLPQCSSHQTLFCFLSPCLSYLLLFQDHCFLIFPAFQTAWQLLQRGVWMGFFWSQHVSFVVFEWEKNCCGILLVVWQKRTFFTTRSCEPDQGLVLCWKPAQGCRQRCCG